MPAQTVTVTVRLTGFSLAAGSVAIVGGVRNGRTLAGDMSFVAWDVATKTRQAGSVDSGDRVRYSSSTGSEPGRYTSAGDPPMPRRLDPKPCACGCGQITKSGEFMRGHHTRRRWQLVKAVARGTEQGEMSHIGAGEYVGANEAGRELARRGWAIPDSYRHFGVELEIIIRNFDQVEAALIQARIPYRVGSYSTRAGRGQWVLKTDGSLYPNEVQIRRGLTHTAELVSPPLRGKRGIAQLRKVMDALAAAGVEVNKTCGGHVHHEARDFDVESFRRLIRTYARLQTAIDRVMPASRRSTAGNTYVQPWTERKVAYLDQAATVAALCSYGQHYDVLNISSFSSYGTVEFRQHAGTVSADKLVNWILFGQALVKAARKGLDVLISERLAAVAAAIGCSPDVAGYFVNRDRQLQAA